MVLAASVRPARLVGRCRREASRAASSSPENTVVAGKTEGGRCDAGRAGSRRRRQGLAQFIGGPPRGGSKGSGPGDSSKVPASKPHLGEHRRAPGGASSQHSPDEGPEHQNRGRNKDRPFQSQSATKCCFLVVVFCTHSVQRFPSRRRRFSAYLFDFSHFFDASRYKRKSLPQTLQFVSKTALCAIYGSQPYGSFRPNQLAEA